MPIARDRWSTLTSNSSKNLDFQQYMYQKEMPHPTWISRHHLIISLISLPESIMWNVALCLLSIIAVLIVSMDFVSEEKVFNFPISSVIELAYNILYALYTIAHLITDCYRYHHEKHEISKKYWLFYVLDAITYLHYLTVFLPKEKIKIIHAVKMACYYIWLRRPFQYLLKMNDYYLKGSVIGTLFKYWYIFAVMRVIFANAFLWFGNLGDVEYSFIPSVMNYTQRKLFFRAFYMVDKRFFAHGIDWPPNTTLGRMATIGVVLSGYILVSGVAIASLALIIRVYLQAEGTFRERYQLITKHMSTSNTSKRLEEKIKTFYKMYWHKQKAVSVTQLLPTFPPTLRHNTYTDIYFEAMQKSRILRDLSNQFLSEIAKQMKTINYVPGDFLIKRNSTKHSVLYISYGDVMMVTAEDDETPILRMTRGTILNPYGGCVEVGSAKDHVAVRAATFCTAHVLKTVDLWRVAAKYGRHNGQSYIMRSSFKEHLEIVKDHYSNHPHPPVKFKSTILTFKRNLLGLKEARKDGKLVMNREDVFLQVADSYLMRSQTGSALIEDSDEICFRTSYPCILQPQSDLQTLWKIFMAGFIIAVTFIHPYFLVYSNITPISFIFFDFVATIIYILDMIVYLSTGDKVEEGVPITFLQTSSQQMRSWWFVVDVVSSVPIFYFIADGQLIGLNKLCKLPEIFRTMKLIERNCGYHKDTVRVLSFIILVVLFIWLVAALNQAYLCLEFDNCHVASLVEPPYWDVTGNKSTTDTETRDTLLFSIFWGITFGTFTSQISSSFISNDFLVQAQVIVMLEISVVLFVLIQSAYAAMTMVSETLRDQFNASIDTIKLFLVKNNIDPILRHRYSNYLELSWFSNKAFRVSHDKNTVLFDLPNHVYQEVSGEMRNKYLLSIPFLQKLPMKIMSSISANMHIFHTSPGEILQNSGDISNEVYVIKCGFCEMLHPTTKKVVSILTSHSHFGDTECLMRFPAYYTVRALTHVQLYSVSRKQLTKAITMPNIRENILHFKHDPVCARLMNTQRRQIVKYQIPPPPPNRVKFPLPRKFQSDAAFLVPFQRLGFFAMFRYVFPRYTIHPGSKYLHRYECFRALCAFLSALLIPNIYLLSMQFPRYYTVCRFLDWTAYFDIVQRLIIGYYNEKGILIYHPASTVAHYIKGSFLVDMLGCLPLENLDNIVVNYYIQKQHHTIVPQSMQLMLFARYLQLYRLFPTLDMLSEYFKRHTFFVIKTVPVLIIMMNTVGTLISMYSVTKIEVQKGVWKLVPITYPQQRYTSWIINNGTNVGYNITETPYNLWLTTIYWAMSHLTTTGFIIFKETSSTALIIIFILGAFVATIVTTIFFVQVLSIRSNVNKQLAKFQRNKNDLIVFMNREKIPKDLKRVVIAYYDFTWEKTGGLDFHAVFKLCDQISLRTDVILNVYGQTFQMCPVLYRCNLSLRQLLGRAAHGIYFRQNMTVIEKGDVIPMIYFVDSGSVIVVDSEGDAIANLPRGSMFGNLHNTIRVQCPNKFVAGMDTHLLRIDAWLFYKMLQDFPAVRGRLIKYRPHDENYVVGYENQPSEIIFGIQRISEESAYIARRRKAIYAHAKIIFIYIIAICIFSIFLNVYNAGFQDNSMLIVVMLYILDVAFIPKMFLDIFLPFVSEQVRDLNTAMMEARQTYLRHEIIYDIISLLPLELCCFLPYFEFLPIRKQWMWFSLLRLNRVIRVVPMSSCLEKYRQNLATDMTLITIARVLIWYTLFIHVTTCIWFSLSIYEDQLKARSSWRWAPDTTDRWKLTNTIGTDVSSTNHFICALYFVVATFTEVGIDDILPRQQSEVVFVCLLMLASSILHMVYVGEVSSIIHFRSYQYFNFYRKYLELQEFLKNNRVSHNLVQQLKKYTVNLWREAHGLQIPQFVEDAPQSLRLNIMSAAYMKHLVKCPIFQFCEPTFLRHLAGYFQPFYYDENMYIVREGEITNSMYFVHRGCVQELLEDFDEETGTYEEGTFFGAVQGLYFDVFYTHTYKTKIKSQILTLPLYKWEMLFNHFPENENIVYKDMIDPRASTEYVKRTKKPRERKQSNVSVYTPQSLTSLSRRLSRDTVTPSRANSAAASFADTVDEKSILTYSKFETDMNSRVTSSELKLATTDISSITRLQDTQTTSQTEPSTLQRLSQISMRSGSTESLATEHQAMQIRSKQTKHSKVRRLSQLSLRSDSLAPIKELTEPTAAKLQATQKKQPPTLKQFSELNAKFVSAEPIKDQSEPPATKFLPTQTKLVKMEPSKLRQSSELSARSILEPIEEITEGPVTAPEAIPTKSKQTEPPTLKRLSELAAKFVSAEPIEELSEPPATEPQLTQTKLEQMEPSEFKRSSELSARSILEPIEEITEVPVTAPEAIPTKSKQMEPPTVKRLSELAAKFVSAEPLEELSEPPAKIQPTQTKLEQMEPSELRRSSELSARSIFEPLEEVTQAPVTELQAIPTKSKQTEPPTLKRLSELAAKFDSAEPIEELSEPPATEPQPTQKKLEQMEPELRRSSELSARSISKLSVRSDSLAPIEKLSEPPAAKLQATQTKQPPTLKQLSELTAKFVTTEPIKKQFEPLTTEPQTTETKLEQKEPSELRQSSELSARPIFERIEEIVETPVTESQAIPTKSKQREPPTMKPLSELAAKFVSAEPIKELTEFPNIIAPVSNKSESDIKLRPLSKASTSSLESIQTLKEQSQPKGKSKLTEESESPSIIELVPKKSASNVKFGRLSDASSSLESIQTLKEQSQPKGKSESPNIIELVPKKSASNVKFGRLSDASSSLESIQTLKEQSQSESKPQPIEELIETPNTKTLVPKKSASNIKSQRFLDEIGISESIETLKEQSQSETKSAKVKQRRATQFFRKIQIDSKLLPADSKDESAESDLSSHQIVDDQQQTRLTFDSKEKHEIEGIGHDPLTTQTIKSLVMSKDDNASMGNKTARNTGIKIDDSPSISLSQTDSTEKKRHLSIASDQGSVTSINRASLEQDEDKDDNSLSEKTLKDIEHKESKNKPEIKKESK